MCAPSGSWADSNEKGDDKMTTKTQRRKPDHLLDYEVVGNSTAEAIHHAIKPLDKIASDAEMKWGCDRLPELVSPELAARFGSAKAKLDAAIIANDPQDVTHRADVLARGWAAMETEATQRGNEALVPDVWSYTTDDGFKCAIARSNADAIKAIRTMPEFEGVAVYSLEEVGRILEANTLLNVVKKNFPDAVVEDIRPRLSRQSLDSDIPF
tara:strand:- start:246 stop:878 length:633 start_codon:yes stop_codon:yes gene_type:complete